MTLRENPVPFRIWGEQFIDEASTEQMEAAAKLPIAVKGALMPDAHVGYGLPIGGVLATEGAVIPYAVGVDIACRMRMTIFPEKGSAIQGQRGRLEKALREETRFGAGVEWSASERGDHEVLDDSAWATDELLRRLKDKAYKQLGTSGSGNHFVEWGVFDLPAADDQLGLNAGSYLALLSHSGSRGVGYQIANHYSRLAMDLHPELDKSVKHLAWLDLDSEEGQAYWQAMQLAGRYAAANHEVIHERIARAVNLKPAAVIENHHNFAWKEKHDGKTVVVHRKGATPAGSGVLGIIPGSMGDAGYVVRGKGNADALNSAAHGAGRVLSRTQAKKTVTRSMIKKYLDERDISLIGGGVDEAPMAYKRIDDIINAQSDLIDVVGKFTPRIVRMDS